MKRLYSLSRFHTSGDILEIERGRWKKREKVERLCLCCNRNTVETEMHAVLQCPKHNDDRLELHEYIDQNNIQSIRYNNDKLFGKFHVPDFPTCGFDFVKVSSWDLPNCNVDVLLYSKPTDEQKLCETILNCWSWGNIGF